MRNSSIIVLLIAVNLILLAALVLVSFDPPQAMAQPAPAGQNYLMCTAQIRGSLDGLYVIDLAQRRMHVFIPNRDLANRKLFHAGVRDLVKDFR